MTARPLLSFSGQRVMPGFYDGANVAHQVTRGKFDGIDSPSTGISTTIRWFENNIQTQLEWRVDLCVCIHPVKSVFLLHPLRPPCLLPPMAQWQMCASTAAWPPLRCYEFCSTSLRLKTVPMILQSTSFMQVEVSDEGSTDSFSLPA